MPLLIGALVFIGGAAATAFGAFTANETTPAKSANSISPLTVITYGTAGYLMYHFARKIIK